MNTDHDMDTVITAESGKHRLTMHFTRTEGNGGDFHSLIWAMWDGSGWANQHVITRESFQPASKHRRWIADLHSFDPGRGRAIIKVAEGEVPVGVLPCHYIYSWREWDLLQNQEVRVLAVCKSPFDKYAWAS